MAERPENVPDSDPAQVRKGASLLRNYVSFIGLAVTAAALTSFGLLMLISFFGPGDNPYSDLITFIFIPSILIFGLALVILGALIERRRRKTVSPDTLPFPVLDLNDPRRRRNIVVMMCLVFAFLFMSAFGSYRAYEYTESVTFCGQACHDVMKPEFVAYQASPHARVRCVECHVGSGAEAYVSSKFNGMRQLYGVVTGHFSRPIETPVHNMRSANATCQNCHWSEKYHGDEIRTFNHYGYDEQNTLNQTRLLVKVGGGDPNSGPVGGIHWHMNIANEVTFIASDERRQVIPWVRMKDRLGRVVEYKTADFQASSDDIGKAKKRTMDCIDCHNRPAHNYLSPNEAVDRAIEAGRIDQSIPFIKAKTVEALSAPYTTNDEAVQAIAMKLDEYYKSTFADLYRTKSTVIAAAVAETQRIYQTYFFPEMKTDWRANPNNIGHYNAEGCFRCHDGQHFSADGQVIRNDCAICHTTLDQTVKGITTTPVDGRFNHPVSLGDKNTWQCSSCHKADRAFVHPLNLGDISRFQCADCHKPGAPKFNFKQ